MIANGITDDQKLSNFLIKKKNLIKPDDEMMRKSSLKKLKI